jgi:16S rRNA (uracil1498-N3)-methyltransferase
VLSGKIAKRQTPNVMQIHRFFIRPESWSSDRLELDQDEAHHCIDVIRAAVGQRIVVFNGRGAEAVAEISGITKSRVQLKTLQISQTPSLPCAITLAQAIPKGKNMELIVQKGTELGVSKIVPLMSERTVVQVEPDEAEKKTEKWRQIVIEAGKQCGQSRLPEVSPPVTPKQFFTDFDRYDIALIASLQSDARSFKSALSDFRQQNGRRPKNVLVLIGPEGDFTPAEAALAKSAGCLPISLGPIVLRTETAAIYCLSVLSYELQGEEM